jgi:hypothetical protein
MGRVVCGGRVNSKDVQRFAVHFPSQLQGAGEAVVEGRVIYLP